MGSSLNLVQNSLTIETKKNEKTKQKLLLIEDSGYLSQAFLVNDINALYQTTKVTKSESLKAELANYLDEHRPDMIVLDIGFCDSEDLTVINDIRHLYDGILFIVSDKKSEEEQITALKFGVDDYLVKPLDSQILMMRIDGLLRRQSKAVNQVDLASLTMGDVCLQPKSQKCFINGQGVKLTTFEFNLLKSLVEHQGNILSREELYNTLLRRSYNGVERTLDVRMSQLREKLTGAGMKDSQIETVWGQGYMFNHISA
ncbi:response regulator transcription factor [Colwellia sp. E2M01]|uniref:response regulator transcription factor n=1 Tax=Colwellia sp. E2M01 TaxID=2841561 RepID=UPI001C08FCB5|nr:response regulator transcription factor [Colwellia sp. E2M01]MBU2872021.1 response regulator transcription factor [Colwellia sp. E2M01]